MNRVPAAEAVPVVEIRELQTHFVDDVGLFGEIFRVKPGRVRAVDGVSISIMRGETWALVGESGSGKTTLGRTILRLGDPTGGDIMVDGQEITRTRQARSAPCGRACR